MFESVTIVDIVNTGALGIVVYFLTMVFNELKEQRKESNQMWRELFNMVYELAKAQGVDSIKEYRDERERQANG